MSNPLTYQNQSLIIENQKFDKTRSIFENQNFDKQFDNRKSNFDNLFDNRKSQSNVDIKI
tara:strand:- start:40 stop:219 length:180 start_codon:yes stop_codon:yes gene_type:complete